jgi:hypothetical protein
VKKQRSIPHTEVDAEGLKLCLCSTIASYINLSFRKSFSSQHSESVKLLYPGVPQGL